MKKNIAVVGCGHWGKNLVRNFAELNALGAVCDPNTELAKKFAIQFNVSNLSFSEVIFCVRTKRYGSASSVAPPGPNCRRKPENRAWRGRRSSQNATR